MQVIIISGGGLVSGEPWFEWQCGIIIFGENLSLSKLIMRDNLVRLHSFSLGGRISFSLGKCTGLTYIVFQWSTTSS